MTSKAMSPGGTADHETAAGGVMERSYYAPRVWLWRVRLDRGETLDRCSPTVHVVAHDPQGAASEARAVMLAAWHDDAERLHPLEVVAVHPVNGIAAPPPPGGSAP